MDRICKYCINKEQCSQCDKGWKDKFIPSEDVKKYFTRGYTGVRGLNGYLYSFNNTNEKLRSTRYVVIGNRPYCPYCGDRMYSIQDKESYEVIGHCCICEGARAELEYRDKLQELEERHQQEKVELQKEYIPKLTYNTEELLEIERRRIVERGNHRCSYFSKYNDKPITDIRQLID